MPSALERAAARFRRELLNNERQAASVMVRAYGAAWGAVSLRVSDLQRQIVEAQAAGATISPAWFYQYNRAQTLQAQIEAELRRFGAYAAESTTGLQSRAVEAARRHSAALVDLAAGVRPVGIEAPFDVLPTAALQDLVGFAADGSPLREVYGEIAGGVADRVTDTMVSAVSAGLGPRETARLIRRQFGTGLARALLVSRTETLRAYREAAHRNYEANSDVVEGWIWYATLGPRTCAACFAMHGSFHELKEHMASHPNCRCTPVPAVKPWKALGYNIPDNRPVIESGETAFARLTAQEQERVLGKAAFAAYRSGAVGLVDFAGRRHSDDWGTTLARRSLQDILGVEPARRWIRAARLTTTRQRLQAAVERRLHDVDVEFVLREVVAARSLPRVGYHFERHAPDLDVNSEEEYLERLAVHLQRGDLVFYALLREQGDLMLYAIAVDTGEVALYNVDRKSLWSFYASADITQFIEQAPIVQLRRPEG